MRYRFGGLIFGGAYTWRGLFSEFYGISRLQLVFACFLVRVLFFFCILFHVVVVVSLQILLLVLVSFFENEPSISCNTDRERWRFLRESHVTQREKKDSARILARKSHLQREKKRKKRASWKRKNQKNQKSNGCSLSFYVGCFGDSLWPQNTV